VYLHFSLVGRKIDLFGYVCFCRYVHPTDKGNLKAQVEMAEICCRLTEQMLELGEKLWIVPEPLVKQIRRSNEEEHYRRY
jgi:hypothetical protein